MKRKNLIILILFLLVFLNTIYSAKKNDDSQWVLKIDDSVISREQFENGLFFALSLNNENDDIIANMINESSVRVSYADFLINETLLLKDADKRKYFSSKDEKVFIKSSLRSAKASFYAKYIADEYKNEIEITDSDIEKAFEVNKHIFNISELNDSNKKNIYNYLVAMKTTEMLKEKIKNLRKDIDIKADLYVLEDIKSYKDSTVILKVNNQKLTLGEFNIELENAISFSNPMHSNKELEADYEVKASYLDSVINQMVFIDEANELNILDIDEAKYYLDIYLSFTKYQKYSNYLMKNFYSEINDIDFDTLKEYFDNNVDNFLNVGILELNEVSEKLIEDYMKYEEAQNQFLLYLQDLKDKSSIVRNENFFTM